MVLEELNEMNYKGDVNHNNNDKMNIHILKLIVDIRLPCLLEVCVCLICLLNILDTKK